MKLQKLTIAAFALSMTGAIAAGYSSDDKSKQRQAEAPAGYSDQAQQGQSTKQQDTLAANQRGSNGASTNGSSAARSDAPAGFADKAQQGQSSRQQDTQGEQAASAASTGGNGSAAAASGNGASASASSDKVRQAQQALQQKGHDPGQIDGVMGPNTKQALKSFQQAQGLQSSGKLDGQTLAALGVQGNGGTQAQASTGGMNTAQASQGRTNGSTQGTDSKLEGTQGFGDKSQKY
jgi:hypothetical protein